MLQLCKMTQNDPTVMKIILKINITFRNMHLHEGLKKS